MLKSKRKITHPEIGEIFVEYSPRRMRVALNITIENGTPQIILKLPAKPHFEPEKYFPFITENAAWIQKKKAELLKKTEIHTYLPGDIFPYLGRKCPLVQDTRTFFDGNEFHISSHSPVLVKRELEKIYYRLAKDFIIPLCYEYAAKFGLTIGQIRINSAAKRWGSCNSKGDLNFSYRLMMKSENFVRYTICHELAHRLHMNHSKAFYTALKRFYPAPAPTE
ncbi:MAG: M48 family metallopeptidase [Lentisphaeria bacterium]|nr:M48 family metallopeptidase [Lentisphaeria bacterium]